MFALNLFKMKIEEVLFGYIESELITELHVGSSRLLNANYVQIFFKECVRAREYKNKIKKYEKRKFFKGQLRLNLLTANG